MIRPVPVYGLFSLFTLLVTIYTLSNPGRFRVVDEVSLYAVTESLALRGEADTNTIAWTQFVNSPGEVLGSFGPDGQVYSKKGAAPAFLAVPWYCFLRLMSRLATSSGYPTGVLQATLLWNGFITAATALLLWLTSRRLGYQDRTGLVLGLIFGLGTIAWPYATHFFGEPLSGLSLLFSFYALLTFRTRRKDVAHQHHRNDILWLTAAGAGAALALTTVTAHFLAVGVLLLFGLQAILARAGNGSEARRQQTGSNKDRKNRAGSSLFRQHLLPLFNERGSRHLPSVCALLCSAMLGVILVLTYNYARFGDALDTGYHFDTGEGFTTPFIDGFAGLTLSPYRGLFWHTPLFIVSVVLYRRFWRAHQWEGSLIGCLSMAFVALYSTWWMWWGGFAWGPRFLVPLAAFWVLPLAPMVEPKLTQRPHLDDKKLVKGAVWAGNAILLLLALLSFTIQLSATTVNYINYEIELRSVFPTDWADPLAHGPPAQHLREFQYSPIFGQAWLLWKNPHANLDVAWLQGESILSADGVVREVFHVQWMTLIAGLLSLLLSAWTLVQWWRTGSSSVRLAGWLLLFLITFLLFWIRGAGENPRLGQHNRGFRGIIADLCADVERGAPPGALLYVAPTAYSVLMHWMPAHCASVPTPYGVAEDGMYEPKTGKLLGNLLQRERTLRFVTGGLPANSPANTVERWLSEHAYLAAATWYDDYRLLQYATPAALQNARSISLEVVLQNPQTPSLLPNRSRVRIHNVRFADEGLKGGNIPVEIAFSIEGNASSSLRWFVQLLGDDGLPVSLLDTAPLDGYGDFSSLPVGETLIEKAGLHIPVDSRPGEYRLIAGLYDPTLQNSRLVSDVGEEFVELGVVAIQ